MCIVRENHVDNFIGRQLHSSFSNWLKLLTGLLFSLAPLKDQLGGNAFIGGICASDIS